MIEKITRNKKRIIPLLLIFAAIVVIRKMGWDRYVTFENLQNHKEHLQLFLREHYFLTVLGFIVLYIVVVGLSIPGATILTLSAGFLFGVERGTLYVNIGATTGAVLIFLLSRYLIGEWVQNKYGNRLTEFNRELSLNGYSYLLTLRLIPLFPFFLINIFAGMTRIPLRTFFWTTAVGIIPGSIVYTFAGSQLRYIQSEKDIFSTKILMALLLLALFALSPAIINHIRALRRSGKTG